MLMNIVSIIILAAITAYLDDGQMMVKKDPHIFSFDSFKNSIEILAKQTEMYLETQFKRGKMERGYVDSEEEISKFVEKIKKEYHGMAANFKQFNENTRELNELCKEVSKYGMSEDKSSIICQKVKKLFRPLERKNVAEFIKQF